MSLPWSGNVRQLENVCRWLTVMSSSQVILPQDLPSDLQQNQQFLYSPKVKLAANHEQWLDLLTYWTKTALENNKQNLLQEVLPQIERTMLACALTYTKGHKQEAARRLGWGRNTISRKLKEFGM